MDFARNSRHLRAIRWSGAITGGQVTPDLTPSEHDRGEHRRFYLRQFSADAPCNPYLLALPEGLHQRSDADAVQQDR
jgi:hypothetical protein